MPKNLVEKWFFCGGCKCFLSPLSKYKSHFLLKHKIKMGERGHSISSLTRSKFRQNIPEPSKILLIRGCQVNLVKLPTRQKKIKEDERAMIINQNGNTNQVQTTKQIVSKRKQWQLLNASKFKCEICSMGFLSPGLVNRHILTKHTKEKPFQCDKCEKRFSRSDSLKSHSRMHSDKTYYNCEHCDKSFKFLATYSHHVNFSHKAEEDRPKFECHLCPLQFDTRGKLATHQQNIHDIQKVKKYVCHLCKKHLDTGSALKNHILMHTGEKSYNCDICDKTFTQNSNLTTHKKIHDRNRPRPFSCDKCNKTFDTKQAVTIHIDSVHDKVKRFFCAICNQGFAYNGQLQTHLRSHVGERPHKCDFCEKSFKSGCCLRLHIKLHLGEKNFRCELCGKGYVQRGNLEAHKRKCGKETIIGKRGRLKNKWNM